MHDRSRETMPRHLFLAGLMAASAMAQGDFASKGFQYIGCIESPPQAFSVKMDLVAGFTVRKCQDACAAKQAHAAAAADGCYCQISLPKPGVDFVKQDDSKCSNPCQPNNPEAGNCGGPAVNVGKKLFSVYWRTQDDLEPADGTSSSSSDIAGLLTAEHPTFVKAESPLPLSGANKLSPQPLPSKPCGCSQASSSAMSSPIPRPKPTCDGPGCPCIGSECFRTSKTNMLLPPTSTSLPVSTSNVVEVSEGSSRRLSAVTAVLAIGSILLAVAMS